MAAASALNPGAAPSQGGPAPLGDARDQAAHAAAMQLEEELRQAGLELLGCCQHMSGRGPGVLQHSPLLEDFTPEELDTLGEAMLLIRAQPGQVLIREGDKSDWMLLLLSGTVDVSKATPPRAHDPATQDHSSRLGVVIEGTSLGEMSMFDSDVRYASCTAIDTVEAAVLGRAAIGQLIRRHPGVGAKLVVKITQLLAQRLRNTSNQLVRLLQQP
jgi:CRP/FNR family cyclic AMP-dependent transcriptional regulator